MCTLHYPPSWANTFSALTPIFEQSVLCQCKTSPPSSSQLVFLEIFRQSLRFPESVFLYRVCDARAYTDQYVSCCRRRCVCVELRACWRSKCKKSKAAVSLCVISWKSLFFKAKKDEILCSHTIRQCHFCAGFPIVPKRCIALHQREAPFSIPSMCVRLRELCVYSWRPEMTQLEVIDRFLGQ